MINHSQNFIKPGIDIEEVSRIAQLHKKWGNSFLRRVFSDVEIEYCFAKKDCYPHLTGRFAAKEAVIKILKSGKAPPLKSIEILREKTGEPVVILHGKAKEAAEKLGIDEIKISISHTGQYAAAFAVATGGLSSKEIS
jgi:holo-[acyl-carrier protein] synthase